MEKPLVTYIGDDEIQIWRMHYVGEHMWPQRQIRKTSVSTWSESVATGGMYGDLVCAVSRVEMRQQRSHYRTLMTRRDEPRQFHEIRQSIRMTVWVIVKM